MPLYEYKCPRCGKIFEVIAKTKTKKCPECGKRAQRQMSRTTFILKGRWAKEGY